MTNSFFISRIRDVKLPERAHQHDAGIDFFVPNDFEPTSVCPNCSICIPTGIRAKIPHGMMLCELNKSGVALKKDFIVGAQVIDENYQGEIHIHLFNVGDRIQHIMPGDKLAQFVLIPISYRNPVLVDDDCLFNELSDRGQGNFGSSGDR